MDKIYTQINELKKQKNKIIEKELEQIILFLYETEKSFTAKELKKELKLQASAGVLGTILSTRYNGLVKVKTNKSSNESNLYSHNLPIVTIAQYDFFNKLGINPYKKFQKN